MKFRKLLVFCLAAFMMLVITAPAIAKVVSPSDQFYFLDDANVLSEATEGEIFFSNVRLNEACGAQFVVVTLKTTGSEAIDDYAYELINSWKIGDSKKQNGLLLLLAIDDDDYYIEPGTGLQSKLSAGSLGGYVDDYLEPEFAAKRYDAAVKGFFEAVFARISDTYNADVTTQQGIADYQAWLAEGNSASDLSFDNGNRDRNNQPEYDDEDIGYGIFGVVIFVLFIVLIILLISRSRRRRRGYGGVNPGVIITPGPVVPPRGPVNGAGPGGYRGANVPPSRPAGGGFRSPSGGLFGGTPRSSGGLFGGSSSSRPSSGGLFGGSSSSSRSSGSLFGGSSSRSSGGLFGGSSSRSSGGSRSFGSARGGGGGSRGGGIGRGRH